MISQLKTTRGQKVPWTRTASAGFLFFRILPKTGRWLVNLVPTVYKNQERQPFSCSRQTFPERHQSCFQCAAMLRVLISFLGIHFFLNVQTQTVSQSDAHVTVFEGASVELRCNYSYSGAPYLFWYIQHHGHGLQFLLKYYSGNPVVHGLNGFEAEFSKSDSSFHLRKASVHWSDAAVYFCALSAQCVGLQGELSTNLSDAGEETAASDSPSFMLTIYVGNLNKLTGSPSWTSL